MNHWQDTIRKIFDKSGYLNAYVCHCRIRRERIVQDLTDIIAMAEEVLDNLPEYPRRKPKKPRIEP